MTAPYERGTGRDRGEPDGIARQIRLDGRPVRELMKLPYSDSRPAFVNPAFIEHEADRIEQEVTPHILKGATLFAQRHGLDTDAMATPDRRNAWLWAVKASKYSAVYNVSRKEASANLEDVQHNAKAIDAVGAFIDMHGGVAPILNFALHSYVQGFAKEPGREVRTGNKHVLINAIQGYDQNTLIVKEGHFLDDPPESSFEIAEEVYDWHDLAHMTAASSSNGAFGAKFHGNYDGVAAGLGIDAAGKIFADGFVFSVFSKQVYEKYEKAISSSGTKMYTTDQTQDLVMQEIFAYLGGGLSFTNPDTGEQVVPQREIDPLELAVGLQHKRYERRAAEVERWLFVRGTPEGARGDPDRDPLVELPRSQRIEAIAQLDDTSLYFETRNLIRHRAHEDALGQFAGYLLEKKKDALSRVTDEQDRRKLHEEVRLLEKCVSFYELADLQSEEINLYRAVGDILRAREER